MSDRQMAKRETGLNMQLTDFIRVYNNVVSDEYCDKLISIAESQGFELYEEPAYRFLQVNINQKGLLDIANDFASALIPIAENYFDSINVSKFISVQGFEQVRIKKYPAGSNFEFSSHIDAANKDTAVRYLIFILYLNDNNGSTVFDQLDFEYEPRKGSVIVFPPFWMFPHSGKTPTDRDKYIMMTSLHFCD